MFLVVLFLALTSYLVLKRLVSDNTTKGQIDIIIIIENDTFSRNINKKNPVTLMSAKSNLHCQVILTLLAATTAQHHSFLPYGHFKAFEYDHHILVRVSTCICLVSVRLFQFSAISCLGAWTILITNFESTSLAV